MMLKEQQFREEGYDVHRDLVSADEIAELKAEVISCLDRSRSILGLPARDELPEPEELLARVLCVHHVHKLSAPLRALAMHPSIIDRLRTYIGPDLKCVQSQLFVKPPGFPGNAWHQDEGPIPTRDRSLVGVWLALDDATQENGCLWVVPGTHRRGYLYPTRHHGQPQRYDFDSESFGFEEADARPVEIQAGSAIFFSGYLVHGSQPNQSNGYRQAMTLHYMSAYSPLNWKGRADYRDFLLVAGEDPYAWKGHEDLSVPHLRPWPATSEGDEPSKLPSTARRKLTAAVGYWSHDEERALALIREALAELEPAPDV